MAVACRLVAVQVFVFSVPAYGRLCDVSAAIAVLRVPCEYLRSCRARRREEEKRGRWEGGGRGSLGVTNLLAIFTRLASRIADTDGGEGEGVREVERALRIGRSGHRR